MRIALFKDVELNFTCLMQQMDYDDDSSCLSGYIRLSEWVDVDLPMLDDVTVAQAEIAELDRLISAPQTPSPMQERRDKLAAKLLDDGDLPMLLQRQAE